MINYSWNSLITSSKFFPSGSVVLFFVFFGWCCIYVLETCNPKVTVLSAGSWRLCSLQTLHEEIHFKLVSVLHQFCTSDLGGCAVAVVWPACLCVVTEKSSWDLKSLSISFVKVIYSLKKKKKERNEGNRSTSNCQMC